MGILQVIDDDSGVPFRIGSGADHEKGGAKTRGRRVLKEVCQANGRWIKKSGCNFAPTKYLYIPKVIRHNRRQAEISASSAIHHLASCSSPPSTRKLSSFALAEADTKPPEFLLWVETAVLNFSIPPSLSQRALEDLS
ncbi:hypothetical protein NMY22_g1482 [Coprinellus aureogranulatus]|nr:hypothetical protein NMY22_g1482 [Coprinellus aureogranulatus]